jgi:hypothetical protein
VAPVWRSRVAVVARRVGALRQSRGGGAASRIEAIDPVIGGLIVLVWRTRAKISTRAT